MSTGEVQVKGLGKWVNNAGKVIFFSGGKILNNSFMGSKKFYYLKFPVSSRFKLYKKKLKKPMIIRQTDHGYGFSLALGGVGAIVYFGITQPEEIFGKKSFDNVQPKKVHVPTKEELLQKQQQEALRLKMDSIKADSIKQDSIKRQLPLEFKR